MEHLVWNFPQKISAQDPGIKREQKERNGLEKKSRFNCKSMATSHTTAQTKQEFLVWMAKTRCGSIQGIKVTDILLDTSCTQTMVRGDLVQQDQLIEGEASTIQCMHGDNVLYPMADAAINLDGLNFNVRAAVSKPLPMSMLLGTDVPQLEQLLRGNPTRIYSQGVKQALVTTRSQTRKEEEEVLKLKEKITAMAKPLGVEQRGVEESTNNREGEAAVGEELVDVNSKQLRKVEVSMLGVGVRTC